MKIVKENRHEAYRKLGEYLKNKKDNEYFNVEIKKWKPLKTQPQLGLYFIAFDFLCTELGISGQSARYMFRKGLEEKYHYKKPTGVFKKNEFTDEEEEIIAPIPLSECNRLEEFQAGFDGLFIEAGDSVPSVDMSEFIEQWEEIKQAEIEKKKEALEV